MKLITLPIPLEIALEVATYGSSGKISEAAQLWFEKQLKLMGYVKELDEIRNIKMKESGENLARILGSDVMKKIDDALKIAKNAMQVANTMNNKN